MSEAFPCPEPGPRDHITPSGACALLRCPLSVAFTDDPRFPGGGESSPALVLGTVAHAVLEAAAKGRVSCREDAALIWDEEITKECARCPESVEWGPPSGWRSYHLKRSRALTHAVAVGSRWSGGRGESGGSGFGGGAEVKLSALGGLLEGRIDLLVVGPPRIIEDYKTGSVRDAVGDMKEEYRVQLQLYAVLDHANSGKWPEKARAVPLVGPPEEIDVDPVDAMALLDEVQSALATYRAAVDGKTVLTLARPSPDACSRCDFRVNCPSFWDSAEPAWVDHGVVAVSGVVQSAVDTGALVGLTVLADVGTLEGEVTIESLPRDRVGDITGLSGSRVAVDGLTRKRGSLSTVRAAPWSRFERIEQ